MNGRPELSTADICRGLADGQWHVAENLARQFREFVPAAKAVRRYAQWHRGRNGPLAPLEVKVAKGAYCWVLTRLNQCRHDGLLESRGGSAGKKEYRLTDKGRQLLNGYDNEQNGNAKG